MRFGAFLDFIRCAFLAARCARAGRSARAGLARCGRGAAVARGAGAGAAALGVGAGRGAARRDTAFAARG